MDNNTGLHAGLVVTVLVKFLYLFAASMLLGLAFGLGTSFLMKRAKSNSVPQVCSLLIASEVVLVAGVSHTLYLGKEGKALPKRSPPFPDLAFMGS